MRKTLGYIISVLGVISIGVGIDFVRGLLNIEIPGRVGPFVFTFVGLGLVIMGVLLISVSGKSQKKREEVPIYEGKKVVGYRRH